MWRQHLGCGGNSLHWGVPGTACCLRTEGLPALYCALHCRSGWGGGLELTRPSICAALLSLALRALVEALRQQTLGRAAFQQVQLDVHYLRPQVGAAARAARAASLLLSSCCQRARACMPASCVARMRSNEFSSLPAGQWRPPPTCPTLTRAFLNHPCPALPPSPPPRAAAPGPGGRQR